MPGGSGGHQDWIIASPNGKGTFVDPTLNGGKHIVPDTIFGSRSFTQFRSHAEPADKRGTVRPRSCPGAAKLIRARRPAIISADLSR